MQHPDPHDPMTPFSEPHLPSPPCCFHLLPRVGGEWGGKVFTLADFWQLRFSHWSPCPWVVPEPPCVPLASLPWNLRA